MANFNIVFDFDGVLVNSERLVKKSMQKAFDLHGLILSDKDFMPFVGRHKEKDHVEILKICGYNEEKFNSLLTKYYEIKDELFEKNLAPNEGTKELLDYLVSKNYKLYICSSSGKEYIENTLNRFNLESYFIEVFGDGTVENPKPAPDIYLHALDKMGLNPKDTLVIEDSLYGLEAAYRAGLDVILLKDIVEIDNKSKEKCLFVANDLYEIKNYL